MDAKQKIIKSIEQMSGKYSPYQIFNDWVKVSSLAVANSITIKGELWEKREKDYLATVSKYDQEDLKRMSHMFRLLGEAYEERIEDVLGEVYMKSGCYNKALGQFFTPYHLAELNAALCIPEDVDEEHIWTINEPSTGGGANIIAACKVLKDKGINYQKCIRVYAQDLDWLGVYMSYLQFSLLGVKARVAQGDTLRQPFTGCNYPMDRVFDTPGWVGAII